MLSFYRLFIFHCLFVLSLLCFWCLLSYLNFIPILSCFCFVLALLFGFLFIYCFLCICFLIFVLLCLPCLTDILQKQFYLFVLLFSMKTLTCPSLYTKLWRIRPNSGMFTASRNLQKANTLLRTRVFAFKPLLKSTL